MSIQQYIRTVREFSYAIACFRSATPINVGMVCSAVKNGGTDAQRSEWLPRLAAGDVKSAKVSATDMCGRIVDRVVQIYGGRGYLAEYDASFFSAMHEPTGFMKAQLKFCSPRLSSICCMNGLPNADVRTMACIIC